MSSHRQSAPPGAGLEQYQFSDPPASAASMSAGIAALSSSDARGLATLLHALYLTIFTLPVKGSRTSADCLLGRRIVKLAVAGDEALKRSADRYLRDFAQAVRRSDWQHGGPLNNQELVVVASRTHLQAVFDPGLLVLVMAALGDTPVRSPGVQLVLPALNGDLYGASATTLSNLTVDTTQVDRELPPYWRLLHGLFDHAEGKDGLDLEQLLRVVARTALPLTPKAFTVVDPYRGRVAVPFANYLSLTALDHLLYGSHPGMRTTYVSPAEYINVVHSRFFGNSDFAIRDLEHARAFVTRMLEQGRTLPGTSPFRELVDALLKSPHGYPRTPSIAEAAGSQTPAFEALADIFDEEAPADGEAPAEPDADDEITLDPAPDDAAPATPPGEDGAPVLPPDSDDDSMDAPAVGEDNTMDLIALVRDSANVNDHLYRRAVLAALRALERNPESGVNPEELELLRVWCNRWLFLAARSETEQLIENLGLRTALSQFTETEGP